MGPFEQNIAAAQCLGFQTILFHSPAQLRKWAGRWHRRLAGEPGTPAEHAVRMRRVNPAFIPRNHRVEQAIAAGMVGDFAPFEALVQVLQRPYDDQPEFAYLAKPPRPEERVSETFCGT